MNEIVLKKFIELQKNNPQTSFSIKTELLPDGKTNYYIEFYIDDNLEYSDTYNVDYANFEDLPTLFYRIIEEMFKNMGINPYNEEKLTSEQIINILNNNRNGNPIIARFDSNGFINTLSGEIKEAYSYITNYKNYNGITLAELEDRDPALINWFASLEGDEANQYPNEVKYCKIIIDWKKKNHLK